MSNANAKKKILFLAANPKNTQPLRLDEEVREIADGLRRASKRDMFDLSQRWAVRARDLRQAMLDIKPQIVHFSGHGAAYGGLILEDTAGEPKLVEPGALAGLFELFKETVECILLNACYSVSQADALTKHINYVIGMSDAISDKAALEFAVGFYDALGDGQPVDIAYKFGCNAIRLEGCPEDLIPKLLRRSLEPVKPPPPPEPPKPPKPPLPPTEPRGSLHPKSAFYVKRPADKFALDTIRYTDLGVTLSIQASGQMGASSLLRRVIDTGREVGKQVVHINFQQAFNDGDFKNPEDFHRRFCAVLSDRLEKSDHMEQDWERYKSLSIGDRCTRYMQSLLRSLRGQPLVLAMDEVDRLIDTDFRSSFFGMLRSWHNQRAMDEHFERLDLVIVTSLEPNQLIDDPNQSPFNVSGEAVLNDFSLDEVHRLSDLYGINSSESQLERLFALIGGHPYLWQLSFHQTAKDLCTFDQLLLAAQRGDDPYRRHLSAWYDFLQGKPELRQALKNILGRRDYDERAFLSLRRAGLVSREGSKVRLRCKLYEDYFREQLYV